MNDTASFRRVDAACNMARFYILSLQPTLFGAIALERHWGRIGTRGRHASRLFDTPEEADAALRAQVKRRFRRGYTRTDGRS